MRRFYFKYHANSIRSYTTARRAFALASVYFANVNREQGIEGAVKVGHLTLARQEGFMRWCRDKHGLRAKTISTYLAYVKAAMRFAAKPRLVTDAGGREREVLILDRAPFIEDGEIAVTKVTGLPRSKPRDWIPLDQELARFIDEIKYEHIFRYVIIALNTWARPEAITELSVKRQVDFERGLIHLNPPGRTQNNKVRPTIRLTNNLRGWLLHWNLDRPIVLTNRPNVPIRAIDNRALARIAQRAGLEQRFTRYTLRHYMATRVRRVEGIQVPREERAIWMGHVDPNYRTTERWYESQDPDYLVNVTRAVDAIMLHLDQLTNRTLFSPEMHPTSGLTLLKRQEK
ncbi:MAG: tyrosine-type recombinase/integrase [Bacteroidota bacterium]